MLTTDLFTSKTKIINTPMTRDNLTKLNRILDYLTNLEIDIVNNAICVNRNTQIKQKDWSNVLYLANLEINEIYQSEKKNY